jgi:hypothetical protein
MVSCEHPTLTGGPDEAISRSGIEQIYRVARLQKSVASTGAGREFSTKLASTRARQHLLEHAQDCTAPEKQSQPYGERLVRTIPADGHRF